MWFGPGQSTLCNCPLLVLQKVLAKQEAQMNLMKQAVEVRALGSEGRGGPGPGPPLLPTFPHTHS